MSVQNKRGSNSGRIGLGRKQNADKGKKTSSYDDKHQGKYCRITKVPVTGSVVEPAANILPLFCNAKDIVEP